MKVENGTLLVELPRNARELVEWIWLGCPFNGQFLGSEYARSGRIRRTWAPSLCLYDSLNETVSRDIQARPEMRTYHSMFIEI